MRAPGHREDRAGIRQRLEGYAALDIPDPDGPFIATAGKRASIGSKGQTGGGLGMPTRPERAHCLTKIFLSSLQASHFLRFCTGLSSKTATSLIRSGAGEEQGIP